MPPVPPSVPGSRDWDDVQRRFRNTYIGNNQGLQRPTDPFQYGNVHVLLFCWEEDDSGAWGEMCALADVLGWGFGYNANCYRIPNYNSYQCVEQTLNGFKHSKLSPNDLVSVYFNGHGDFDDRVRLRAYPRSVPDRRSSEFYQEMDLSAIMISLRSMGADVLFLQICWEGGILSTVQHPRAGALQLAQNSVEVMASCGY